MNPNLHTAEVLPPRAMIFLGIIALHVVFAWVLTKGLLPAIGKILRPEPIQYIPIEDFKPPPPQSRIEEPQLIKPGPIVVPQPDDPVTVVNDPVFDDIVAEPPAGPTITDARPATPVEERIRLIGHNVMPNTQDYYPARERREGTEGSAVVRACVNENGRLDGAPMLESSSGSAGLDNAAIKLARDGKYARSLRGEVPVPNCHRFRVTFTLR